MTTYWDAHYSGFSEAAPSPFCQTIIESQLKPTDSVIELGCGNGRDGLALTGRAAHYTGVDLSTTAIQTARELFAQSGLPADAYSLEVGDYSEIDFAALKAMRLMIYSRFSLHADDEIAEDSLLDHLDAYAGGPLIVCIEARTVHDELFGQGALIARNTYMTDHFRRFIVPEEFEQKVAKRFTLHSLEVSRDFAPYKNENPRVMRVVFSKGL